MGIKISVIGAGSAVFSLDLVRDLCNNEHFSGCTVSFMDIDEKRLETVYQLCSRYAKELGRDLKIETTTDRIASLTGADFVINTALRVNYKLWVKGWQIAEGLGYRYGGSLHIMHDEAFWINFYQFGLMESVYQDMLKVCPNAWYLLVANPVLAGITMMKRKYPNSKIIGLCHGYRGVYAIAEILGLDFGRVRYEVSGVNHLIWLTHFSYDGKDMLPVMDEFIKKDPDAFWNKCRMKHLTGPKQVDLYRRFGVFPIGDTGHPGGGAWGYWYHSDEETDKYWRDFPEQWFKEAYFHDNRERMEEMERIAHDPTARVTEHYPPLQAAVTNEPMVQVIEAIAFDVPNVLIVNIQNTGEYVPGIPRDFSVEVPALLSAAGVQALPCKPLPRSVIARILHDRVASVNQELEAYESGSYHLLLDMILMDPWTKSEKQARQLLDAILNLPEFTEMKAHYR